MSGWSEPGGGAGGGDALEERVRALFENLRHAGEPVDSPGGSAVSAPATGAQMLCGEAGRTRHGTRIRFSLRVAERAIVEARYRAYGCPHTLATCEWLARRLQGCQLVALSAEGLSAAVGGPTDWAAALGVPPAKLGRLLIIEDALRGALRASAAETQAADASGPEASGLAPGTVHADSAVTKDA